MKRENWKRKKKVDIEDEFFRLAQCLIHQGGDIRPLIDLIPFERQKSFVVDWHSNDELDQ